MITAETNGFDKYLKDHLPREVFAKLSLRTIISLVLLLLASSQSDFSFYDHFVQSVDALTMPVKVMVPFILFMSIYALMFKDLEHAFPDAWSQETSKGAAGAALRSLSAECLLWMSSAFVSIFVFVMILGFVIPYHEYTIGLFSKIVIILVYLTIFVAFFVSAYLLVKRHHPPLADSARFTEKLNSPRKVAAFYCANSLVVLATYAVTAKF